MISSTNIGHNPRKAFIMPTEIISAPSRSLLKMRAEVCIKLGEIRRGWL